MKFVFLSVLFLFLPVTSNADVNEDVVRISPSELMAKIDGNQGLLIIDVRDVLKGKKLPERIIGAVLMPFMDLYKGKNLPENKSLDIVLYCS